MISEKLPTRTAARIALLAAFWVLVGLFGGTAVWIGERVAGVSLSWRDAVLPALGAGVLWIPITLVAARLANRFPLRPGALLKPLLVHGSAALAVSFVLNLAFVGGTIILAGRDLGASGWLTAAAAVGFRFLHINALVYCVIVGLVHVASARQERAAGMPEATGRSAAATGPGGHRYASRLEARSGGRTTLLRVDDIRWIEADGDYARVHVDGADHLVSERMKRLESQLDPARFVRIHRSRIVNVERVRRLRHLSHGDYEVTLDDDTSLRVSRARRKQLLAAIERTRGAPTRL